jgi:hypothetical protein
MCGVFGRVWTDLSLGARLREIGGPRLCRPARRSRSSRRRTPGRGSPRGSTASRPRGDLDGEWPRLSGPARWSGPPATRPRDRGDRPSFVPLSGLEARHTYTCLAACRSRRAHRRHPDRGPLFARSSDSRRRPFGPGFADHASRRHEQAIAAPPPCAPRRRHVQPAASRRPIDDVDAEGASRCADDG